MKTTPNPNPNNWNVYNYDWSTIDDYWANDANVSSTSSEDYAEGDDELPSWYGYVDFLSRMTSVTQSVNTRFSLVAVVVNVAHLLVLVQKRTRSSAVFIFMIGVAIADIPNFAFSSVEDASSFKFSPEAIRYEGIKYLCIKDETWAVIDIYGQIIASGYGATRRISIWLALLLALVRVVSVMFPMSARIQKFTTPLSTCLITLVTFIVCFVWETGFLFWYSRVFRLKEISIKKCRHSTKQELESLVVVLPYKMFLDLDFNQLAVETVVKWTPTILYPVMTALLFLELRTIRKRRKGLRHEDRRAEHTTLLILVTTFSFSITEFVAGMALFIEMNTYEGIAWYTWNHDSLLDANTIFVIKSCVMQFSIALRCFNSTVHPIVCIFISSQYRETVESAVFDNRIGRSVTKMMSSSRAGRSGATKKSSDVVSSAVSPTVLT